MPRRGPTPSRAHRMGRSRSCPRENEWLENGGLGGRGVLPPSTRRGSTRSLELLVGRGPRCPLPPLPGSIPPPASPVPRLARTFRRGNGVWVCERDREEARAIPGRGRGRVHSQEAEAEGVERSGPSGPWYPGRNEWSGSRADERSPPGWRYEYASARS